MKRGAVAGLALVFVAVTAIVAPRVQARGGLGGNTSTKGAYCSGAYADDFAALSAAAREAEQKPQSQSWVYAIRTSAVYECLSYAGDGNVRRVRRKALAHGTGFGYRQQNGETFILTNHHVAEWPPVTDDEHKVDDVPPGCKRVSDALRIVESERDSYDRDDIPLQRVVTDKSMDMAVLKAHALLPILPWKVGRSSDLKERNVVDVRGFPLGAFKATNVGKVVSTYDHDDEKDWDHVDFVVDAQLSPGNSGSPVLAVSCRTGEFELVGVFHARYVRASALNVVVAIDQVRELMTTLKRSPRPADHSPVLDAAARGRLIDAIRADPDPPYFAVGALVASLHVRGDGALVFALFASDFPRTPGALLALEDVAATDPAVFGALGAIYLGGPAGLHAYPTTDAEAEVHALLSRTLIALRESAIAAFEYRSAKRTAADSRSAFDRAAARRRVFERTLDAQRDTAQAIVELVGRETPRAAGAALGLAEIQAEPREATPSPTPVAAAPG